MRDNDKTNMNPRQTVHDLVKEFNDRYPPFERRPRSVEETCRAQDFVIWEDPASGNDDDLQNIPVPSSSDSLYCSANSHPWISTSQSAHTNMPDTARISTSPSAHTNPPDTARMSEQDIKALNLMMARSTRYSIAYASDNTFNEDDEKDEVQRGFATPCMFRNYSEERARPQGSRPPLGDITAETIIADIAKLNQTSTNLQLDPGSPAFALTAGRTKPNFCSSPLHLTTAADEYDDPDSAASDNISEASTEYSYGNTPPSKSSPLIEKSLFHVYPYINPTPRQSPAWSSPREKSESESLGDENQSLKGLHTRVNPTEYIVTASSSSSPCLQTSSHRHRRSVAFSSTIAPRQKKSHRFSPIGVQASRSHLGGHTPVNRHSPHTGLTAGAPVCYVNGNNLEPPVRTPLGLANRREAGHSPARLFTTVGRSGIEGFWGDKD